MLSEVLEGFTKKVGEQIGAIRKALSCGDAETVKKEAHAIKGGAANISAMPLSRVAYGLESKGKTKELNGAGEITDSLEREFEALKRFIQEHFQENDDKPQTVHEGYAMRILVVDDELVSRKKMEIIMRTLGECVAVDSGKPH